MTERPLTALILLHNGFEEIEATTPIDLLSRAGIEVVQAAIGNRLEVKGRSGITLQANCGFSAISDQNYDVIILPGGPGIQELRDDDGLCQLLKRHSKNEALLACICAAPLLLKDADLLNRKTYTAHPSTREELPSATNDLVCVDGMLITSRGAGTATEFALAIVQKLCGFQLTKKIADSICWPQPLQTI